MTPQEFKNWIILNAGLKANTQTVASYYSKMVTFFNQFTEFNQANMDQFLLHQATNNKASSFNAYLAAFKMYNKAVNGSLTFPKSKTIKLNKVIKYLPWEQLESDILAYLPKIYEGTELLKNELILRFLFETGVRRGEMLSLKRADINLKTREITTRNTKNGYTLIKDMTPEMAKDLELYFNREEEKENAFNLKPTSIKNLFKRIKQELGLEEFHPHMSRHSYAKHLVQNGCDLFSLQTLLGHSDLKITQRYADPTRDMVKEAYDNATKKWNKRKRGKK